MHHLSLHQLTVGSDDFCELVDVTAATGCKRFCLFTHDPDDVEGAGSGGKLFPVLNDMAAAYEVVRRCRDLGVSAFNVDAFVLTPDFHVARMQRGLEIGAMLGAQRATVLSFDPVRSRAASNFALLSEAAEKCGIRCGLEYFGPSEIKTLADATEFLVLSGRADAVLTLDTLHSFRNGVLPSAIDEHAFTLIDVLQVSDGPSHRPTEQIFFEATSDRLLPGDGAFPLDDYLAAVSADTAISIEIPCMTPDLYPFDKARVAVEATRRWLTKSGRAFG